MKRYKIEYGFLIDTEPNEILRYPYKEYVDADIAQELYRSTDIALKAIYQLADEYGAIPEYLDDITSVLEGVLEKADKE